MAKKPDYILLGVITALIILGILILADVSASFSVERFGNTYHFLKHQLLFGLLPGLILAFLVFKARLNFLRKLAPILLLINLIFLGMVFLPKTGIKSGGATRWMDLGPVSFQPAEFLKLTFILYLASWLTSRTEKTKLQRTKKEFGQTLIAFLILISLISLFLILQPNISTLELIVSVATLMYFLAKTPPWHIILIILIGIGSLISLIKLAPYRMERILVFLNPKVDPMGIGYHVKQALIVVGSGGIFGQGLGMSQLKFGFLPQSISDSIFAVFAQECGFIGASFLIFLFLIFLWRGLRIGKLSQDKFSQLTAWGITIWIYLQSFINIGTMIGILPLTGIPLPFISYGGSALIAELVGVGILLNISKNTS